MAHIHGVYDTDTHFKLNAITKELSVGDDCKKVIQHDHNSERFSFEMPRFIEGHDMTTCNNVEIHYLNVDSATKAESVGMYMVDDLQVSPEDEDVVICSWLISANATKYVGPLYFVLRLECVSDGAIQYALNSLVYEGIYIGKGIYNADRIMYEYPDVLEQWKQEILNNVGVSEEQIESAVNKYLEENPVEGTITVDSSLSETSENPVQNKVVKAELDKKLKTDWGEEYNGTYIKVYNGVAQPVGETKPIIQVDYELDTESIAPISNKPVAEAINALSGQKADKSYVVAVFEELKNLIQNGQTDSAIAVLDKAILDLSVLA